MAGLCVEGKSCRSDKQRPSTVKYEDHAVIYEDRKLANIDGFSPTSVSEDLFAKFAFSKSVSDRFTSDEQYYPTTHH